MAALIDDRDVELQTHRLGLRFGAGQDRPCAGEGQPDLVADDQRRIGVRAGRGTRRCPRPGEGFRDGGRPATTLPIAATAQLQPSLKSLCWKPSKNASRIATRWASVMTSR